MKILIQLLVFFINACASSNGDKHPRQGAKYTIVCKYFMQQCYFKAQDRCEGRGYHLHSTNETMRTGGPEGRYREFTMLIQCK